jgi:hypothetical protein
MTVLAVLYPGLDKIAIPYLTFWYDTHYSAKNNPRNDDIHNPQTVSGHFLVALSGGEQLNACGT